MGYKLADGSDSDLYRSGDTFYYIKSVGRFVAGETILTAHYHTFIPDKGGKITISLNGNDGYVGEIGELTPTEETKRKVAERNQPKCKCGYVIPVMEVAEQTSSTVDFFELNNAIELCLNMQAKKAEGDFSYDGLDEHIDRLLDLQYAALTGIKVVD